MSTKITIVKKEEGVFIVSPVGAIDSETYEEFDEKMAETLNSSPKGIIFDMKGLVYIASLGMSVIFKTKKAIENSGGTLAIVNVQPHIKKVFNIVKLLPSRIFDSMAEARQRVPGDNLLAQINPPISPMLPPGIG